MSNGKLYKVEVSSVDNKSNYSENLPFWWEPNADDILSFLRLMRSYTKYKSESVKWSYI